MPGKSFFGQSELKTREDTTAGAQAVQFTWLFLYNVIDGSPDRHNLITLLLVALWLSRVARKLSAFLSRQARPAVPTERPGRLPARISSSQKEPL